MNSEYEFLLDNMIFSYSKLECYRQCKYRFMLNYFILKKDDETGCFGEFGKYSHTLLEKYFKGDLLIFELANEYCNHYGEFVHNTFPPSRGEPLYDKYYNQGLEYFSNDNNLSSFDKYEILGVEDELTFSLGDYKFVGVLDLEVRNQDGDYEIIDHKSKSEQHITRLTKKHNIEDWVKTTDGRYIPFELCIQLYLYSIPFKEKYGVYPKYLNWNMFRIGDWYKIEFNESDFEKAKKWAINTISDIYNEQNWDQVDNVSDFFCRYLCDNATFCKYSDRYVGEV